MKSCCVVIWADNLKLTDWFVPTQTTKDDTDAEIERIKAEIETEQKSKETIGGVRLG